MRSIENIKIHKQFRRTRFFDNNCLQKEEREEYYDLRGKTSSSCFSASINPAATSDLYNSTTCGLTSIGESCNSIATRLVSSSTVLVPSLLSHKLAISSLTRNLTFARLMSSIVPSGFFTRCPFFFGLKVEGSKACSTVEFSSWIA